MFYTFHHLLLVQPLERPLNAGGVRFHPSATMCLSSAKPILRDPRWSVTCVTCTNCPLTQQCTSHRLGAATRVWTSISTLMGIKCRTQTVCCSVQDTHLCPACYWKAVSIDPAWMSLCHKIIEIYIILKCYSVVWLFILIPQTCIDTCTSQLVRKLVVAINRAGP